MTIWSRQTFQKTLLLGWYDIETLDHVKSKLKQRCIRQRSNWQRWTTSNQRSLFRRWYEQCYMNNDMNIDYIELITSNSPIPIYICKIIIFTYVWLPIFVITNLHWLLIKLLRMQSLHFYKLYILSKRETALIKSWGYIKTAENRGSCGELLRENDF